MLEVMLFIVTIHKKIINDLSFVKDNKCNGKMYIVSIMIPPVISFKCICVFNFV